jgi:hypothetical protein
MTNPVADAGSAWHEGRVAPRIPGLSWLGRRRHGQHEAPPDTIDLREPVRPVPEGSAAVLERLAQLRDAGLITNAEYEKERRSLLGADGPS